MRWHAERELKGRKAGLGNTPKESRLLPTALPGRGRHPGRPYRLAALANMRPPAQHLRLRAFAHCLLGDMPGMEVGPIRSHSGGTVPRRVDREVITHTQQPRQRPPHAICLRVLISTAAAYAHIFVSDVIVTMSARRAARASTAVRPRAACGIGPAGRRVRRQTQPRLRRHRRRLLDPS